jgi:glycosyltransferase involved in cell wall biosynthesis
VAVGGGVMKIAVVSDAVAPWHVGGKEARYREILRRIEGKGVEVHIYTMRWWGMGRMPGHTAIMPRMKLYKPDGQRSMLQAAVFSVACFRLLFVKADLIEADHMPGPQLLTLAAVARIRRIPLVATWHEYWGAGTWEEYLGKLGRIGALVEKLGARYVDAIVAVSGQTRQDLLRDGIEAGKVHLVPNGTWTGKPRAATASEERAGLVTFGRLIPHKRVEIAIATLAELRRRGHDLELTVIGEGTEREKLERLAGELEVSDQVCFTGVLEEQAEVWERVSRAQACIMPSEREGYGIAVAEALAVGTPVVVSDAKMNAARHLVDDGSTGRICTAGSVDSFADGVETVLQYDHLAVQRRFTEGGEGCSWDDSAGRQLRIYEELLSSRGKA